MSNLKIKSKSLTWGVALLTLSFAGCKSKGVDDASLSTAVQNQLNGDTALSGQAIQTSVSGGVVTLSGSVANDAQRTIAARDAAYVAGVKKVVDTISIGNAASMPLTASSAPAAPLPSAPQSTIKRSAVIERTPAAVASSPAPPPPAVEQQHEPAPIERNGATYTPPPPPPPPPAPSYATLTIPAGDTLAVRMTQTLDSATTQPGQAFSGVTASDIVIDGLVALPAGSAVSGHVDDVREAAHYKGQSLLSVSLSSVSRRGDRIQVSSEAYTVEGKARGKNTAEKVGGGAAVGAILGGILGGGKGAAIGAGVGGGAGAGANTITRGQQVQIESESVVRFKLTSPITVKVRTDSGEHEDRQGKPLQPGE